MRDNKGKGGIAEEWKKVITELSRIIAIEDYQNLTSEEQNLITVN